MQKVFLLWPSIHTPNAVSEGAIYPVLNKVTDTLDFKIKYWYIKLAILGSTAFNIIWKPSFLNLYLLIKPLLKLPAR